MKKFSVDALSATVINVLSIIGAIAVVLGFVWLATYAETCGWTC